MNLEVMSIVLFAALLHAVWNALIKSGVDKLLDSIMLCGGAGALALIAIPFLPLPAASSWPYLVASTAIHVVYFSLVAFAYRHADMSFIYPLMRGSAPLFTALLGVLVLHETPAWGGWVGVSLLCAGVCALALEGWRSANVRRQSWIIGLSNAAVIVAYTLIDGMGVRVSGSAGSYVAWLFVLTAVPMLAIGVALRGRYLALPHRVWGKGLASGACSVVSYGLALWAMTMAPVALVAALRETAVLFGAIIAALLLHEKFGFLRWLAASLVCGGIAAMKIL